MNKYLLEIGVEEFPSRFIASTKKQIAEGMEKNLAACGLKAESVTVRSTPRRFAVEVTGIEPVDAEGEEIVRGPAVRIAFDAEGNPSKALEGFLRSKGVALEDTYRELKGKEEYVFARIQKEAVSVPEALKKAVPEVVRGVSNPRSMRWGGRSLQFLRPIRWFVSLYNDEVLPFDLERIPVSNVTRGHRFLGSQHIELGSIDEYAAKLEENYVIIDEKKRRDIIVRGLNRLAREKGGVPMLDEELLDEVVSIVEYPTVFLGRIPERYLSLPSEVIITPMKDHQRYFPVLDDQKKLLPFFLSVRNGDSQGIENVVAGNERVLTPRLEDAKFFYDQDRSRPLEAYCERLSDLTFHEQLGSMADKTARLESLVGRLGALLSVGEETVKFAKRAAFLSKADLVTQMVVEFTELQGTMGRIYAEESGENKIVARAIEDQYMPRSSGAELPESTAGTLLALADRIDTIAGLYAIDIRVTGSQDPFGLRRAAIGIIDILTSKGLYLDLAKVFREALVLYVEQRGLVFDYDEVQGRISEFFRGRLERKLRDDGLRYDIVDAVLATKGFDINALVEKTRAIARLCEEGKEDLITSFVRVQSMAEKSTTRALDPSLLEEGEVAMADSIVREKVVHDAIDKHHYDAALEELGQWMPIVNEYLDNTMILVEDEAVRANRLAMLDHVYGCVRQLLIPQRIVRK